MLTYPPVAASSLYSRSQVFVCFFVVIALTHGSIRTFRVQNELPRVVVSASFSTFRSVRIVL